MNNCTQKDIPYALGIVAPGLSVLLLLAAPFLPETIYFRGFLSETGFIEIATFMFLAIAIIFLLKLLRSWSNRPNSQRIFFLILLLGTVYFAGEEIDWGQVWLDFSSPAAIEEVNREGQFSLHKIDKHPVPRFLFNNGPRLVATLALLFAGGIALRRGRIKDALPHEWRSTAELLLPTVAVAPTCFLAATATLPAKILKIMYAGEDGIPAYLELSLRKPSGEFKEYCIALSILLYVWSTYRRSNCRNDA